MSNQFVFFHDDEIAWWDEAESAPPAPPPDLRPPRRRTRARTPTRRQAGSPPLAYVGLLAATILLALAFRALLAGAPEARQPTVAPPLAPPAPAPSGSSVPGLPATPLLREGNRGGRVAELQVALVATGHYGGLPDRAFGASTGVALAAFQSSRGLVADGVAGPATAEALHAALAEAAREDAAAVDAGLDEGVAAGRLDEETAAAARASLADALTASEKLSPGRRAVFGLLLDDIAASAGTGDAARTKALFALLEQNAAGLARRLETLPTGVADGTGVVYRFFPSHGLQFHPLASFARLNRLVADGEAARTERLANALVARGTPRGRTTVWEYGFPFGGPAPWTSGFSQAVAAQSLARAGTLLSDQALLEQAGRAFRAIPQSHMLDLGGAWIREYSYSDMAVLNAHLQSIVSLLQYVELSGDEQARVVVAEMSEAAQALVPAFDTGCWTLYAYGGAPATPAYHAYHVQLARQLARLTEDGLWRETAARWENYRRRGGC